MASAPKREHWLTGHDWAGRADQGATRRLSSCHSNKGEEEEEGGSAPTAGAVEMLPEGYRLVEELSAHNGASVCLAFDEVDGELVIVKTLVKAKVPSWYDCSITSVSRACSLCA